MRTGGRAVQAEGKTSPKNWKRKGLPHLGKLKCDQGAGTKNVKKGGIHGVICCCEVKQGQDSKECLDLAKCAEEQLVSGLHLFSQWN